ncbi:hypothetical protein SAMN04489860_2143 [Paraoerskovia marina]|uniref:Secreted protein n=1 Tax=Paraoerskovia marina TaxID=545619 RepID=A0A1H1UBP6_9CELL|nr:hypothetical protein [Paraoerskovia marina]SDS69656.1 hypothetical protein SAMN04489860_2143 [Paraoerskovia marina]
MAQQARWGVHRPASRTGTVAAALAGTPGLIRALLVLCLVVVATAGVVVSGVARSQESALRTAGEEASRLGDIQATSTALASADAYATNAFLAAGRDEVDTLAQFAAEMDTASSMLPQLARTGSSGDAAYLSQINVDLSTYNNLAAQAQANNRHGLAVGAAYLSNASTLMREDIRPDLATLISRGDYRVRSAIDGTGVANAVAVPFLVVLAVLLGVQVWLAVRTHRLVNPGMALATLVVFASGTVTILLIEDARTTALEARDGPYSVATLMSGAQASANTAKSNESLGLIQQGSGNEREQAVELALDRAYGQIQTANEHGGVGGTAKANLTTWNQRHDEIRALDDAGDWSGAVDMSTDQSHSSANASFSQFRNAAETEVRAATARADEEFAAAEDMTSLASTVAAVGLTVGAAGVWWGLARRLDEYR